MEPLWEPHWGAKISATGQKCLPGAPLGPLPKTVSTYVAFLTLLTLEMKLLPRRELNSHCAALSPKSLQNGVPKPPFWGASGPSTAYNAEN